MKPIEFSPISTQDLPAEHGLSDKQILVTGGTGFIGGRLIEKLVLECGAQVRVLVHNYARAARIARLPVEMVHGDIVNPDDIHRAIQGCEIVFHCAYGNSGTEETRKLVNVQGTENILAAALHSGVKRIVYLSTMMVYGDTTDGDLDETAPHRYSGNAYADTKLDAEKIAFNYIEQHSLPVVVLQPTTVYGPFAPVWTANVLQRLKAQRVILINDGSGLCNAVYIDDLVSAMLLAAVKDKALGQAFLISGLQPVTWRDFYGAFERMLGTSSTVAMSAAEAKAYYAANRPKRRGLLKELTSIMREDSLRRRLLRTPEAAVATKLIRSLVPDSLRHPLKRRILGNGAVARPVVESNGQIPGTEKPLPPMRPATIQFYAAKTRVRIDKATRILCYQPLFDLESGMKLVEQWARWANLLEDENL